MKLVTFEGPHGRSYGIATAAGIVDLGHRIGDEFPAVLDLLAADALDRAHAHKDEAADHKLTDVTLLPPVTRPGKIWCIGVNYADRNAEYKDASDQPKYPSLFVRAATSFVGHGTPLERPKVSEQLDYEGEIVMVIGKAARHVSKADAWDHIAGFTIGNEGTVRDWLRHGKFNVTQGKNFDRSGSIGPWLVTRDEFAKGKPFQLSTFVNGEVRQKDSTERLMFPFDALIEYLSTFATLEPGDMIFTGTPTGAGVRLDPPVWLKPGDTVEVSVSGIGTLSNGVVDEA